MSVRREVFQAKVLQRLCPAPPKPEKGFSAPVRCPEALISPKSVHLKPSKVTGGCSRSLSGLSGRKLYTVLPPPEGYVPVSGDESARPTDPEPVNNADEMHDSDAHNRAEDKDRTRNRRKRRRKTKADVPADGPPPPCAAGHAPGLESLSKNKRRKLKKKRHKEKLRALGLVSRSAALEFTYRQSDQEEEEEEDGESSQKLKDVLDFLQSTQELYFSDRSHTATLPVSAVESLFTLLSDGPSHPALVSNLYELRALLAQSDVERLNTALREFSRTSALPNDETSAVCTLFHYWMTQVLPMKNEGTT